MNLTDCAPTAISAATVSGVAPRRNQQGNVVVLLRRGDAEADADAIEERRFGERYAETAIVIADVEQQFVFAGQQRVAFEQGLVAVAVSVAECDCNGLVHRSAPQFDQHAGRWATVCRVEYMSGELAHADSQKNTPLPHRIVYTLNRGSSGAVSPRASLGGDLNPLTRAASPALPAFRTDKDRRAAMCM